MSLTESSEVFVSAHETAINDLVTAICQTRPHLLSYGSPAFVPASDVYDTQMPPILFPGSGGIEWHVRFSIPHLDLFDEDSPLPPELSLGPGQFSLSTTVELCVDCRKGGRRDDGGKDDGGKDDGHDHPDEPNRDRPWDDKPSKVEHPVCTKLDVFAVGHLVGTSTAGGPAVGFALDAVEIVDIHPDELESVLECLLAQMLRAALAQVRLPVSALQAGAFSLTPTVGPLIDTDVVLARGNL
ncbi:hypothetical protein [Intrasporangium calvum]|uniref:Uncharacterized protein n=1 Tax=Intrasporangium calvum (strain ATCC 23552 / DSM 43043 / JCM 3097 / NBRC 12989 / NCIMB 10167 / NRRL B-3866 / 7 KIP) TaxID=710696 RepID=E6S6X0_INTC7|nr:hypothetical protein [Intrasporangium calvum]ADU46856.1 hypothetical protein Intca_0301 [Intrasporangium calvum DSM 43043]